MKKLYICLFLLVVSLTVATKQKALETAKPDFKNWSGISK